MENKEYQSNVFENKETKGTTGDKSKRVIFLQVLQHPTGKNYIETYTSEGTGNYKDLYLEKKERREFDNYEDLKNNIFPDLTEKVEFCFIVDKENRADFLNAIEFERTCMLTHPIKPWILRFSFLDSNSYEKFIPVDYLSQKREAIINQVNMAVDEFQEMSKVLKTERPDIFSDDSIEYLCTLRDLLNTRHNQLLEVGNSLQALNEAFKSLK